MSQGLSVSRYTSLQMARLCSLIFYRDVGTFLPRLPFPARGDGTLPRGKQWASLTWEKSILQSLLTLQAYDEPRAAKWAETWEWTSPTWAWPRQGLLSSLEMLAHSLGLCCISSYPLTTFLMWLRIIICHEFALTSNINKSKGGWSLRLKICPWTFFYFMYQK